MKAPTETASGMPGTPRTVTVEVRFKDGRLVDSLAIDPTDTGALSHAASWAGKQALLQRFVTVDGCPDPLTGDVDPGAWLRSAIAGMDGEQTEQGIAADALGLESTSPQPAPPSDPAPLDATVESVDSTTMTGSVAPTDVSGPSELDGARAIATRIVESDALTDRDVVTAEVTGALLMLEDADPVAFAQVELRLQREKKLWTALQGVLDKLRQKEVARLVVVQSQIAGAPVPDDALVPAGYKLTPHETLRRRGAGAGEVIAYAPLVIAGKLRDVQTDAEAFRLSWKDGPAWRSTIVDRAAALDSSRLTGATANTGGPVSSITAKAIVEYLAAYEASNPRLPVSRTSSQLGWQGLKGKDGFMLGDSHVASAGVDPITFRPQAGGDAQLAASFTTAGTLREWWEAVSIVGAFPRAAFTLYAAFVPPLLELLDAPNFILDLANPTSTGKTSAVRLAASVWGQPVESLPGSLVQTWDATKVWIERASTVLSGLPMILDDTKRAKTPQLVADVLYLIAQGRGRGRGNVASVDRVRTWRTVGISTGEAPATSFTQDGGTRMRCLELRGMPFDRQDGETRRVVDRLNSAVATHYGHAGELFVRWLVEHRDEWASLRSEYQAARARYAERNGRLGGYVAAVEIAARLAHNLFEFPWAVGDVFETVWPQLASEADDAPGAGRALAHVLSWAESNAVRFLGRHEYHGDGSIRAPSGGWAGSWRPEPSWRHLCFYPNVLNDVLRLGTYEPEAVLAQWRASGWLNTASDRGRYQRQVRIGRGEVRWMVMIRREALDELAASASPESVGA